MDDVKKTADQTQYLGFYIAEEEYAIGILRVKEILEYDTITKVPFPRPRSLELQATIEYQRIVAALRQRIAAIS